jgi:hypothetical protein
MSLHLQQTFLRRHPCIHHYTTNPLLLILYISHIITKLGEELSKLLRDQKSLDSRFEDLHSESDKLKVLTSKIKGQKGAVLDVAGGLQQNAQCNIQSKSFFSICLDTYRVEISRSDLARNLKSHPNVAQNLQKIQTERNSLHSLLSKTIRELRDNKFDSLINTVEEEKKKRDTLQNTINRYVSTVDHCAGF